MALRISAVLKSRTSAVISPLRGDFRPLYLGWLAGAPELDDDVLEPEVPSGLADLSAAQQALVEFLEIDVDLLQAASAASAGTHLPEGDDEERLHAWLRGWIHDDAMRVVELLAKGQSQEAERRVRSRYAAWLKAQRPVTSPAPRRTLAELRDLAETASAARFEREANRRAQEDAERRRHREAQLRQLMSDVETHWAAIDAQASRGSASGYEHAVRMLRELADGYALTSSAKEFDRALRRLLVRHATRGALLRRLTQAGLWAG